MKTDGGKVVFRKNDFSIFLSSMFLFIIDFILIIIMIKYEGFLMILILLAFNIPLLTLLLLFPRYFGTKIEIEKTFGLRWIYKNEVLYSLRWDEIQSVISIPVEGWQSIMFNGEQNLSCNIYKKKLKYIILFCDDEEVKVKLSEIRLLI